MVSGGVKGAPSDSSQALDRSVIAMKFWELYQARSEIRARVGRCGAGAIVGVSDGALSHRRRSLPHVSDLLGTS